MHELLLDTGPLVALLDSTDRWHRPCREFFSRFQGKLISTEAVLTEALHLLGGNFRYQKRCLDFFIQGVRLISLTAESLQRCLTLMSQYHLKIEMDFADASLVVLADHFNLDAIFTIDRRGFETYRWDKNKPFKIFPERIP